MQRPQHPGSHTRGLIRLGRLHEPSSFTVPERSLVWPAFCSCTLHCEHEPHVLIEKSISFIPKAIYLLMLINTVRYLTLEKKKKFFFIEEHLNEWLNLSSDSRWYLDKNSEGSPQKHKYFPLPMILEIKLNLCTCDVFHTADGSKRDAEIDYLKIRWTSTSHFSFLTQD